MGLKPSLIVKPIDPCSNEIWSNVYNCESFFTSPMIFIEPIFGSWRRYSSVRKDFCRQKQQKRTEAKRNYSPKKSERNETLGPKKRRLGTVRAISRTGFFGSYSSSFCFLSSFTKKTEFLKKEPKTQHQKYSLEQSWLAFCSFRRKTTTTTPTTTSTLFRRS